MGGPVERAEEGTGCDRRVGGAQRAAVDAVGDQRANAALVAVAFGDDPRPQPCRQRVDLEVCGRSFDAIHEAQHVRDGDVSQPRGQMPAIA